MQKLYWVAVALAAGLLGCGGSAAIASTIQMETYSSGEPQQGQCPKKVVAYQTPQLYREGGFATDGMVRLSDIATQVAVAQTDPFSVTWVGNLKPAFQSCQATAGMAVVDGSPYTDHSYLRLRILGGKVHFILDMTGVRDANGFTAVILSKKVVQGNPRWTWGGTD